MTLDEPDPDVLTLLLVRPSPACTVTEFGPALVLALVLPPPAVTELDMAPLRDVPGGCSPGLR